MSWDSVEAKVEIMLRTAFKAATDSASLAPRYRCFWADSTAQALTFPCVDITASGAINDGWRTTIFKVPVAIEIMTAPIDDPTGSVNRAIYRAVRGAIEGATLAVSGWQAAPVTVENSGRPAVIKPDDDVPTGLRVVPLDLMADVAL